MAEPVFIATGTLGFVREDIQNQIARSRDLLTQIHNLKMTAARIDDPGIKRELENTIAQLVVIADRLTDNAETTASSAITETAASNTASFVYGNPFKRKP